MTCCSTSERSSPTWRLRGTQATPNSLKGVLGEGKVNLPREEFSRADWERMTDLYFAVRNLLMLGLVTGTAADGGKHLNRFQITDAGRAELAADAKKGDGNA